MGILTVSQTNPTALFSTISEAIQVAKPKTRILVDPGTYREALLIEKEIDLVGNGSSEQIVIESNETTCVRLKSDCGSFSNLTIRGIGEDNQYAVFINQGGWHFQQCRFSSSGTSVHVMNEGAAPTFEACTFHSSKMGLTLSEGTTSKLKDCTVEGNSQIGIKVEKRANPLIRHTRIVENEVGASFLEEAHGTFESCEFFENDHGVLVTTKAAPIFDSCHFGDNTQHFKLEDQGVCIVHRCSVKGGTVGMEVLGQSYATIMESTFEQNEEHQIWVEESSVQLKDSELKESQIGVYVKDVFRSQIENTSFVGHSVAGITLERENDIFIHKSKVEGADCGVCFQKKATGAVQECEIVSSVLTGIAVLDKSEPKIVDCQVKQGQNVGLFLQQGKGKVINSRFSENAYLDLLGEGENETVLENCSFDKKRMFTQEEVSTPTESLFQVLDELHSYIGLEEVKERISDLIDFITYTKERQKAGISTQTSISHHCLFLGKPGTGKTTIARLMSKIFYHLGLVKKGHCVEVDRKDLVGEYIGQTSMKTNKVLKKAVGGVLFIDEAYTLVKPDTPNDFGREALDLILKKMEDDPSFIVIAAGYPEEMQPFIEANPGLKDRFKSHYHFEDYTPEQLVQILEKMLGEEEYWMAPEAVELIRSEFLELYRKRDRTFGNARMVRKFFEELKMNHAKRCTRYQQFEKAALTSITVEDVKPLLRVNQEQASEPIPVNEDRLTELLAHLDGFIGLEKVKREIREIVKLVKYYQEEGKDYTGKFAPHTVFLGNPGTGKTTIARLLSQIYEALGILPVGNLVETSRDDFVAGYVGQTALKTTEVLNRAMGSTLFIDEAYALTKQSDFGQEAIDTILKRMEDDRGKFSLIVAGYTQEMKKFLKSNPGLASRFGRAIQFEDYSPAEMVQIAKKMVKDEGFRMETEVVERLQGYFEECYQNRDRYFSNARLVRNVVERMIRSATLRLADLDKEDRKGKNILTTTDFIGIFV
ncbi:right-handed parallel beta-helix repeat-containing protein [Neobacillus sp. D3-1R]|uniref:right-handed parallel beta-helix repeat-containing protein n=1 Tax=Neobacillus sp. D3-1R TaxID=3445778 RepID=UPI003FA01FC3